MWKTSSLSQIMLSKQYTLRKLEKTLGQKVSGLTGGIKMPGGFPGF